MAKIRGYRYYIVEMYPGREPGTDCISKILMYDNLESAQDVLDAMNRNNFNFSCYYILMDPVYERPRVTKEDVLAGPEFVPCGAEEYVSVDEPTSDSSIPPYPGWEMVEEELPDPPF